MLTPTLNLLAPLLHGKQAERIFAPDAQLAQMVRFELALACSLESAGIAPPGTGTACEGAAADFPRLAHQQLIAAEAAGSGNIAIPFVKYLTRHVREQAGEAADFVHFGATSQDVLDTALVLSLLEFSAVLSEQLVRLTAELVSLTERHRQTLLAGRTWMQQGPPVTLGLKTAQALAAILRHRERLARATLDVSTLQFGGAVGTLASLGEHGISVAEELARRLLLSNPAIPWHSQRDTIVEYSNVLALLAGSLGKLARDLSLMVQTEVSEVSFATPEGAGGSSTMPHKRNPVALAVVLSAAVRAPGLQSTMLSAMVQEHERGLGGWHAEWETLPELCRITEAATEALIGALTTMEVDLSAAERNRNQHGGVAMAEAVTMRLSPFLGRPTAHALLEHACRAALEQGKPLAVILSAEPSVTQHLSPQALEAALDPAAYLGSSATFIDQVLHAARLAAGDL